MSVRKINALVGRPSLPQVGKVITLPPDFDWVCYIENNSDLPRAGIRTEAGAIKHYLQFGHRENRVYSKKTTAKRALVTTDVSPSPASPPPSDPVDPIVSPPLPISTQPISLDGTPSVSSITIANVVSPTTIIGKQQIAIVTHIGYLNLAEEICLHLAHTFHRNDVHYHFSILKEHYDTAVNKISAHLASKSNVAFFHKVDNFGMDIGGFFQILPHIQGKYTYILKLHTKRDKNWRNIMFNSLIGSKERFDRNVRSLQEEPKNGMLVPAKYHFNIARWSGNLRPHFLRIAADYGITSLHEDKHFSAGTCFFVRSVFIDYIKSNVEINRVRGERNYINARHGSHTHAWERFFAIIVHYHRQRVIPV